MDAQLYNSLTKVEYLITFNAFIYGFILSRFFSGWGRIISNRRHVVFSLEHILWSVYAFFMLLSLWWYSWLDIETITLRSVSFYASIVSPFIMYLISSLYFQHVREGKVTNLVTESKFQRKKGAVLYFFLYLFHLLNSVSDPSKSGTIKFFVLGLGVCSVVFWSRHRWTGHSMLVVGFAGILVFMCQIPSYFATPRWLADQFSFSEYLVTFITFVYGFIVAKFLEGWTAFLKNRRLIRFNIDYILWTLLVFGLIIDYWWRLYERSLPSSRTFGYFVLSLVVPIGFSFLSSLLFNDRTNAIRAQDHFRRNQKLIFGIFVAVFFFDFLGSVIINARNIVHVDNIFLLLRS
ncbi:MAG TPA: hypothetical protein VEB86_04445, partial [Chryseosolibacter sp.]|nr:hypothetical protein [Chryseosolibacter sp.]